MLFCTGKVPRCVDGVPGRVGRWRAGSSPRTMPGASADLSGPHRSPVKRRCQPEHRNFCASTRRRSVRGRSNRRSFARSAQRSPSEHSVRKTPAAATDLRPQTSQSGRPTIAALGTPDLERRVDRIIQECYSDAGEAQSHAMLTNEDRQWPSLPRVGTTTHIDPDSASACREQRMKTTYALRHTESNNLRTTPLLP